MGILKSLRSWLNSKRIVLTSDAENTVAKSSTVASLLLTAEDIYQRFTEAGLEKYYEAVRPHIRPGIQLITKPFEESNFEPGQTKIGGHPDFKKGMQWPISPKGVPMSFIGQINCAEAALFDQEGLLPQSGLLLFFYDADQSVWGFGPEDKDYFKVIHIEVCADIQTVEFPESLIAESRFNANQVSFVSYLSLPNWENVLNRIDFSDKELDKYSELTAESGNQMLGHPECIQGPMELGCQLVTNGLNCGDANAYKNPKSKALEPGAKDWILLLQVDSEDEKTGMMWGDAGRLYFWIKEQDLKNKYFDNVWCILQCF